ncbi:MAG TPA: tyrosine-type recombinase/integrase [Candidatus Saccharimonadales bacterium]|nr:tyrosine-type recombinase/integrase [Candidatus Saccharimonadales bacterium]
MSLYKRGGTYWYKFRWTIKIEDGKRENYLIRRSARTSNAKKAREAEEEHRRALRIGLIHPADPWPKTEQQAPAVPTLREFIKQFVGYVQIQKKQGTATFYEVCSNRVLRFAPLADALLTEVTGEQVSKYAQWRRSMSPGESVLTVNGELRTLRRMLNLAQEWGLIAQAPIIHELPGGKGRERVISFAEEMQYLAAASATVRDVAILAADTGLRPNSELFLLEWANVRLEGSQEAPQGFIHIVQGKTDSAVRNIPLTPRTREMLLARKQSCGTSRYLFPGPGKSGHLTTVQHAHEKTVRDAGLESFEFYCWRHTFGTRCAESGMDKFTLARLMGHSSPRVAERYYIHVTEPHVMTGFERFLNYHSSKLADAVPKQTVTVQ